MRGWHLLAITLAILTLGCVSQPGSQTKTDSYNTSTLDSMIASFTKTTDEYILAVDTTGGNTADHAVVGVSKEGKFEAWDGTYDGEGHAPPEYKTWKIISKMPIEKE